MSAADPDPTGVLLAVDDRGVAAVTLNRPNRANTFNQPMLDAIAAALARWEADPAVRLVVLRAAGRHFCGGAEIGGEFAHGPEARNTVPAVCARFAALSRPTVALVHGACVGGGVALAAACDIVLAANEAVFAVPEVRLGLTPGPLLPLMAAGLGLRGLRRYGLSGERFGPAAALQCGLVHETGELALMERRLAEIVDALLLGAPGAVARTKQGLVDAAGGFEPGLIAALEQDFEARREGAEAQEGAASFRAGRKPAWYPG